MILSAAFVGTKRTFVALKGYRHQGSSEKPTFKIIVLIIKGSRGVLLHYPIYKTP